MYKYYASDFWGNFTFRTKSRQLYTWDSKAFLTFLQGIWLDAERNYNKLCENLKAYYAEDLVNYMVKSQIMW